MRSPLLELAGVESAETERERELAVSAGRREEQLHDRRDAVCRAIVSSLLAAGLLAGCTKPPPPAAHATPTPARSAMPSTLSKGPAALDAGTTDGAVTTPTPPAATPIPTREDLTLVAVGKAWGAKILWLSEHGSRVWLSGRNVDALADGDGPLETQTDPLKGLPYRAGKHVLLMAGIHPRLYVLRYEQREVPSMPSHPTVFVRTARGWTQAKPLKETFLPVAFVPWGEGALVVHSQVGPSIPAGTPSYAPERPGTSFEYVAPDGTVSGPSLTVERSFLAWAADSDGKTLSLLGTVRRDRAGVDPEFTIELARGSTGTLERTALFQTTDFPWAELSLARPQERGENALVLPPNNNTEAGGWKPSARTLYETTTGGPRATTVPGDRDACRIIDARQDRGSLLAIEECIDGARRLLRLGASGFQHVRLPSLAKDKDNFRLATVSVTAPFPCEPVHLLHRGADDLWVRAECKSEQHTVPAVFRRGHAQKTVVVLP